MATPNKNDKKKRLVELTVTDEMPLDAISFVAHPAIEENFLAFSQGAVVYAKFDGDKQVVTGPAMVPDVNIDRLDPNTGEQYQVYFSQDTVRKVAENYLKMHRQDAVNVEHSQPTDNITLFESWIVSDPKNDKANALGYDLPAGTWMVSFKVNDASFWAEQVKSGKVKGFSIEGPFIEIAASKNKPQKMKRRLSIYKKIKEALGMGFADDTLADGTMITADDGFVVGAAVNVVAPDGSQNPIPDGTYNLSDGTMITVAGGTVSEVSTAAEETAEGDMAKNAPPAPDATAAPADGAKPEAADQDLQKQIDELKKQVEALTNAAKMKEEELTTANAQLTAMTTEKTALEAKVVELSSQPGAEPVKKTAMALSIEKNVETFNSRVDRIRELRKTKV